MYVTFIDMHGPCLQFSLHKLSCKQKPQQQSTQHLNNHFPGSCDFVREPVIDLQPIFCRRTSWPHTNGVSALLSHLVIEAACRVCRTGFMRPSAVSLSQRLTAATAASRFAAARRHLQQLSIDSCGRRAAAAGAQQQIRVVSCWEAESRRRRLNTRLVKNWITTG